ncbi:helicase [Pseudomonas aeruginosa]|nr:helicase [Pseudomonas aeruginosa]
MLSAVRRYKSMLSSALARCFPRTTAYLQAEREAREALLQPAKAAPGRTPRRLRPRPPASCEGRRSGDPTQARCRLAGRAAGNLSGCRTEGRRIPGAHHARAGGAGRDARCGQPAVRGTVGDDPLPPAAGADLCRCRLGQVDHPGPAGGVHALPPGRRAAAADSDFLHQRLLYAVARTIAAAARALAVPVRRGPGAAVRAHFPFGARQPGPRGARQSALVRTTGRPRPRRRAGQPPCRRTPASGPAAPAEAGLPAVLRGKPGVPRQDPTSCWNCRRRRSRKRARDGSRRRRWSRSSWPASSRRCRCTKPSMPRPGSPRAWACASNAWTAASWNAGCARRSSSKPWHCSGRGSRRCCARRA